MTPYIQALRAITFTTFRALFIPAAWIVGGSLVVLVILDILLAVMYSTWWLLFLIILIPLVLLALVIGAILWAIARRMAPRALSPEERRCITTFTDKLKRIAEARATPLPIIVILIAKDVVRGKKSDYLENMINDSTTLKQDFMEITALFRTGSTTKSQFDTNTVKG